MAEKINKSDLTIDRILSKLKEMKIEYTLNEVYNNPVTLDEFFKKFSALTAILESHYAKARATKTRKTMEMYNYMTVQIDNEGKKVTQAELERRSNAHLIDTISDVKELETESKSCRNHCTTMQSIMRSYSDEAKGLK